MTHAPAGGRYDSRAWAPSDPLWSECLLARPTPHRKRQRVYPSAAPDDPHIKWRGKLSPRDPQGNVDVQTMDPLRVLRHRGVYPSQACFQGLPRVALMRMKLAETLAERADAQR